MSKLLLLLVVVALAFLILRAPKSSTPPIDGKTPTSGKLVPCKNCGVYVVAGARCGCDSKNADRAP